MKLKMTRYKFEPEILAVIEAIAEGHRHANGARVNLTDAVRIAVIEAGLARGLFKKRKPGKPVKWEPISAPVAKRLGYRDRAGRFNRSGERA